ncbi:MAG: hypothetical protein QOJ35_3225 [Solirubrobacteraceae bacterium]|jgi:hypothetical protein|nr:hypothetical protein [Solirubrobacteraceae bacterium]
MSVDMATVKATDEPRPKVTVAQLIATATAGVPIILSVLVAFGVHMNKAQQDALTSALNWAIPFAGLLILGDAALRASRNHADARVRVAVAGSAGLAGTASEGAAIVGPAPGAPAAAANTLAQGTDGRPVFVLKL